MTSIAALTTTEGVYIGADSYSDNGTLKTLVNDKLHSYPVAEGRSLIIGMCGTSRLHAALYLLKPDLELLEKDYGIYITFGLPEAIRENARSIGYLQNDNGRDHLENNELLIAYDQAIFVMDSVFNVKRIGRGYHAIGSGTAAAMGAFYAADDHAEFNTRISGRDRVLLALEAAGDIDAYTAPPYVVLRTNGNEQS